MNEELSFPNPVPRSDRPVRRRKSKWPRVLGVLLVVALLVGIFLPQILSTRVGKHIVAMYLAGKFNPNATVSVGDFQTHWFGPTSASQVWIVGQDGKRIGCGTFECEAGLGKLLRGKFDLGKTSIDRGLVEWVYDDQDGSNLPRFLAPPPPPKPGELPAAPPPAPRFSADLSFTNSVVFFSHGYVIREDNGPLSKQYNLAVFGNAAGSCKISALDQPFTYDVDVNVGAPDPSKIEKFTPHLLGAIHSAGTIDLGDWTKPTNLARKFDLTFTGKDIQPVVLGPVFWPQWTALDFMRSFGPNFNAVKADLATHDSRVEFTRFDVIGGTSRIQIKPVIELAGPFATFDIRPAVPKAGTAPADNFITLTPSAGVCRDILAYVNPFFRDAEPGVGTATVRIDSLSFPLAVPKALSMTGRLEAHNVRLTTPTVTVAGTPRSLTAALAVWTGAFDRPPLLDLAPSPFSVGGGQLHVPAAALSVDALALTLSGSLRLDSTGPLTMSLTLNNGPAAAPRLFADVPGLASLANGATDPSRPAGTPPGTLTVPLVGTVEAPKLDFDAAADAMPADVGRAFGGAIVHQTADIRRREIDSSMRDKTRRADEVLNRKEPGLKAWNMAGSSSRNAETATTKPED